MMIETYYVQCDPAPGIGCGHFYPGDMDRCPKCNCPTEFYALPAKLPNDIYVYDIETYPDTFTMRIRHPASEYGQKFEISDRINEHDRLNWYLEQLRRSGSRMVGYNNVFFDWPIIRYIMKTPGITVSDIYDKAMDIINGEKIWCPQEIPQIDLFKIHHFDNMAKSTSLKALEFAMRMDTIQDLPFPVGKALNYNEKEVLHKYNDHDVEATIYFYVRTLDMISFRDKLSKKYSKNFTNFNDTKIGKEYFIMKLEESGVKCFENKQPIQTPREVIPLGYLIFPYIRFDQPEFNRILNYFKSKTITETKGVFLNLTATINGFTYVFGAGGLHASLSSQLIESDDTYQIVDVDVASYYPNLAIKNKLFPEHLSAKFCEIYEDVFEQRKKFKKGTPENAMLKLALNGVYGDSNNVYSPFYDPAYTMSITINGQLLLCMLVEQLLKVPDLIMVQCNTDGVTYRCRHEYLEHTRFICKNWEQFTLLTLEEALYSRFWIRDVNNYIAEYAETKKVKRKGAYEFEIEYHKDPSALIIQKAIVAHLVEGADIRDYITHHPDKFDFMLRAKVPRNSNLVLRFEIDGKFIDAPMQRVTRYYVAEKGGFLVKISPPTGTPGAFKKKNGVSKFDFKRIVDSLPPGTWDERVHTKNRSVYETREIGLSVTWNVAECNDADKFDWSNLNYDYYIKEAEKLIIGI